MIEQEQGGYQGSETSRVEVALYMHGDEPGLLEARPGVLNLRGIRDSDDSKKPALVSLSTNKVLGAASGTFSLDLKSDPTRFDPLASIAEDDWIDISFTRHNRKFHVMRGLIDSVRRGSAVVDGATTTVYRLSGRDFGKVFEVTPVWFNPYIEPILFEFAHHEIFVSRGTYGREADAVIDAILSGFLRKIEDRGRANWFLPPSMPVLGGTQFIESLFFFDRDYESTPRRVAMIDPWNQYMPRGQFVWNFAQSWADLDILELYSDLLAQAPGGHDVTLPDDVDVKGFSVVAPDLDYIGKSAGGIQESTPKDTAMGVIFRMRPFPTFERPESVEAGPWFSSIPLYEVPRQQVASLNTGRSGQERVNGFIQSVSALQSIVPILSELQLPLLDDEDIARHGLRLGKYDTKYVPLSAGTTEGSQKILEGFQDYQKIIRDFHCMDHLFLNGTAELTLSRPDIRVGGRFRVKGRTTKDETYYIEGVSHNWRYGAGAKTNLALSRGFVGTDSDLIDTLFKIREKFEPAVRIARE